MNKNRPHEHKYGKENIFKIGNASIISDANNSTESYGSVIHHTLRQCRPTG